MLHPLALFVKVVYRSKTDISEHAITPSTSFDQRELNVIVHGITEDDTGARTDVIVAELCDTLGLNYQPTTLADRLGSKSPEKSRPIRITMESYERKREFMSKLWRLKHGPPKFQKISITEDFTQEERKEIKRWVDEAKRRTDLEKGYVWKIRGSPRSKIRMVKMSA